MKPPSLWQLFVMVVFGIIAVMVFWYFVLTWLEG
jgi:hypothetical protein